MRHYEWKRPAVKRIANNYFQIKKDRTFEQEIKIVPCEINFVYVPTLTNLLSMVFFLSLFPSFLSCFPPRFFPPKHSFGF